MHLGIFTGVLLLTFAAAAHYDLLKVSPNDKPEIGNYAFEGEIIKLLEDIREKMKANGLDPLPIPKYDFSFYLLDADLSGYIGDMLVYNVSDFKVGNVKFDLLQFKISIELLFEVLVLDGQYKINGNIFEDLLDGEGSFVSNTTNLAVTAVLDLGSNFANSHIEQLDLSFIFDDDQIQYNNIKTGETDLKLNNEYLQPYIYRIRDEYLPVVLNTLKVVGSDLIHDYPIQDIISIIISIITGGNERANTYFNELINKP